jgi:hypothetical protein
MPCCQSQASSTCAGVAGACAAATLSTTGSVSVLLLGSAGVGKACQSGMPKGE